MNSTSSKKDFSIIKTLCIFAILLLLGASLIYFGSRNDAVSIAKSLKSGIVTTDNVNIAFEHVGGKLIKRHVSESDYVKKGDTLMQLDDIDMELAIEKMGAQISAQQALIRHEKSAIQIAERAIALQEITGWKKIEELLATLASSRSEEQLAVTNYHRMLKLRQTGHVSQSELDNTENALTQAKLTVTQSERQLETAMQGATEAQKKTAIPNTKSYGDLVTNYY